MRLAAVVGLALGLVLAVATFAASVSAREVTASERANLAQTLATFDRAMRAKDYATVVDLMPPKLLSAAAKDAGLGVREYRAGTIKQMSGEESPFISFAFDLPKTRHLTLSNGEPFAFVPSVVVTRAPDGVKLQNTSDVLAVLDGGKWYLANIGNPAQIKLLNQAYPAFKGVSFAKSVTRVIRE